MTIIGWILLVCFALEVLAAMFWDKRVIERDGSYRAMDAVFSLLAIIFIWTKLH